MFRASAAGLPGPDEHATVDLSYGIGHERETEKITKTESEKEKKEEGGKEEGGSASHTWISDSRPRLLFR